jgi:hypothetical protein
MGMGLRTSGEGSTQGFLEGGRTASKEARKARKGRTLLWRGARRTLAFANFKV